MPAAATLALLVALNRSSAPAALGSQPITCATNANISDSGCGNTGTGNSGSGNVGWGNSGAGNVGNGNSGFLNQGNGNSGVGNVGNGNSGCGNVGLGNSGGGNVGVGNSGGTTCHPVVVPKVPPTTKVPTTKVTTSSGVPAALSVVPVASATLPLTGRNSDAPLTVAAGLMLMGGATVVLANRRRRAMATVSGREPVSMASAVGLLLTGRAKSGSEHQPKG